MTALRLPHMAETPPAPTPFGSGDLSCLNHLRRIALACRVKPRADLFQACALISTDPQSSRDAHAEALMRCLPEALARRPLMLRAGSPEVSFDEAWLIRLARSIACHDTDSTAFLLASRIAPAHRRHIRFLVGHISEYFSPV